MTIAVFDSFKNLKVKYKILLLFAILFALMVDLSALNITSVKDVQTSTNNIAEKSIPRLIKTTSIKDNLNLAILSAYDYVQTGNPQSKEKYKNTLHQALVSEVELFTLSTSDEDFEFSTSFQSYINDINSSLDDLVRAYEEGAGSERIQRQLTAVSASRDAFATFLNKEVETKVQQQSASERQQTARQVEQTIMNVVVVGVITIIAFVLLYIFIRRSITLPVQELTRAAQDIGQGKFRSVNVDSRDELGLFAETFNVMTINIRTTQEALQVELEKTKKLDRQKTEFLSIAAHQLRTPMSGIKWVVNMAVEGDFGQISGEAKEQLSKGLKNIDRMVTLINGLLDVTQLETEEVQYSMKKTDVQKMVAHVVDAFEHNAQQKQVSLGLEPTVTMVPEAALDSDRIIMALNNLIDNAIKYTPKGGRVSVAVRQAGNRVEIAVADTGYGIPPEEQQRVFSKFFRGSNIQTIQADGSGLGLFIVHEIIARHNGTITCDSTINKGTTFTISLPITS